MSDSTRRNASSARWLLVVAWMAVIFTLSSIPGASLPSAPPSLGHLIEYSILGALLVFALVPGHSGRRAVALALLIASAYGITDELHQAFTPGRTPDIADWGIDTISALGGAVAAAWLLRPGQARRSPAPDEADDLSQ